VASVYTRVIVSDWLDSTSRATQGLPIGE
jgi:hypothetical protein